MRSSRRRVHAGRRREHAARPAWHARRGRSSREYERKRDPKQTPEPFGGARQRAEGADLRRPAPRRPPAPLRLPARARRRARLAGRCRRASRSSRASARSPSTSRTTRSTTRRSRARSRQGNYGAGTVEIWDSGTYELVEEKRDGGLTVRLHGERLEGTWTLVPAHLDGNEKNWLLIRKRDETARSAPCRSDYKPMLATLADELPTGDDWLYEVKWDGYRALGYVRGGEARLVVAQRQRPDGALPGRREGAREGARGRRTCVVDGEVCALDEQGRPSFSAMQQGKPGTPIVYAVFDLLEIDGEPLVDLPLDERRERLEELLDERQKTVQLSERFDDGEALLRGGARAGARGRDRQAAAARATAEGKRTRDWLKIKTHGRQEFVICGYTKGQGRRAGTLRLARARRRIAATSSRWVGNCRHRVQRARDRRAARASSSRSQRDDPPFAAVAEDAEGAQGRRRLGRAEARRARSSSPSGRTTATCARRRSRGCATTSRRARCTASSRSRRVRRARVQAVEPRQGLLARRGDHEGRPARLLPRGRAGAPARTCATGRSRCGAIPTARSARRSSRRTRRRTCRTGSRRFRVAGLDARVAAARRSGSRRRSSTTRTRCSGW